MEEALTGPDQFASGTKGASLEAWVCAHYEEHGPGLRRYLARLIGDRRDAEDLVHEVFLRLFEELRGEQQIKNLRPWLFQVGHNMAIDLLRRRGHEQWQPADERHDQSPTAESTLLAAERHRQVRRGLGLLSTQERQVIELRAEGLRYREIASLMGLQVSTVTTFMSRAVQKISRQLND